MSHMPRQPIHKKCRPIYVANHILLFSVFLSLSISLFSLETQPRFFFCFISCVFLFRSLGLNFTIDRQMLSVRKNLTEILLEVTNEEIYAVAQDTLSKVRTKGQNKSQYFFVVNVVVQMIFHSCKCAMNTCHERHNSC